MMPRIALLGLTVMLAGCQYAGNPFDGFGGFLDDTHTFKSNPNLPAGGDETMRRVEGTDVVPAPLLPESGDIWPGPMQPIPSVQELQQKNMEQLPAPNIPAAPPPPLFQQAPPAPNALPSPTVSTPQGPAIVTHNPNGVSTFTAPGGGQGILVPNGNGTSTLIGPDGSIQTVPTPK